MSSSDPESSGDSPFEDVYIAERILDQRVVAGKVEYLLKWKNYPKYVLYIVHMLHSCFLLFLVQTSHCGLCHQ
jgi:hypothetical protein